MRTGLKPRSVRRKKYDGNKISAARGIARRETGGGRKREIEESWAAGEEARKRRATTRADLYPITQT